MSEKNFRQGVGNHSQSNKSRGEGLGKVSKIRSSEEAPKLSRSDHRAAAAAKKTNFTLFWSFLLGIFAIILIGGFAYMWLSPAIKRADALAQKNAKKPVEKVLPVAPTEHELEQSAFKALRVATLAEVPTIFHVREVPAEEILAFMLETPSRDGAYDSIQHLGTMESDTLTAEGAGVVFTKPDGKTDQRLMLFTPDENGIWKVEFESYARTCTPPIQEFLSNLSIQEATVRVYIAKDIYYNSVFNDDRKWSCFLLSSPDFEQPFYGYCDMKTPQHEAMVKLLTNQNLNRATLRIKRVEGATNRQFEITRVLTEEWVPLRK